METLSFDVILDVSTLHLWFTCVRLPGSYLTHSLCAFSMTLTTPALDRRSSRWFEASPCRAASEGRPSISDAASFSSVRSSTSKPPLAFAAHPFAVLDVGLASGYLLDVARVYQQELEAVLKQVEERLPKHASRLHRHMRDALGRQPVSQRQQIVGHGAERADLLPCLPAGARHDHARHDRPLVNVQPATALVNRVHGSSLPLMTRGTG